MRRGRCRGDGAGLGRRSSVRGVVKGRGAPRPRAGHRVRYSPAGVGCAARGARVGSPGPEERDGESSREAAWVGLGLSAEARAGVSCSPLMERSGADRGSSASRPVALARRCSVAQKAEGP